MCFCPPDCEDCRVAEKTEYFLSDRSLVSLIGPRRAGRENFALSVADAARAMGKRVAVIPGDPCDRPDVIVFLRKPDALGMERPGNPDADVMYAQDLCHQVPAVVRIGSAQRIR